MDLLIPLAAFLVGPLVCYLLGRWRIGMRAKLALWVVLCWWWLPVLAVMGWPGLVESWQLVAAAAGFSAAMNGIPLIIGIALGEQAVRDRRRPGSGHPSRAALPPPPA